VDLITIKLHELFSSLWEPGEACVRVCDYIYIYIYWWMNWHLCAYAFTEPSSSSQNNGLLRAPSCLLETAPPSFSSPPRFSAKWLALSLTLTPSSNFGLIWRNSFSASTMDTQVGHTNHVMVGLAMDSNSKYFFAIFRHKGKLERIKYWPN